MANVYYEQDADKSDPDSILYLHILIYLFAATCLGVPCGSPPDTSLPNILGTAIVFRCIHNTTRAQKPFGVPGLAQIGDDYPPGLFLGM